MCSIVCGSKVRLVNFYFPNQNDSWRESYKSTLSNSYKSPRSANTFVSSKKFLRVLHRIMAPEAAPQNPPSTSLPPLLALPVELKLEILSNIPDHNKSRALALMILRRTHRSFRSIIPNPKTELSIGFFLAAEKHPYLFPLLCGCGENPRGLSNHCSKPLVRHYPCYICKRLRSGQGEFHEYKVACLSSRRISRDMGYLRGPICDICMAKWRGPDGRYPPLNRAYNRE